MSDNYSIDVEINPKLLQVFNNGFEDSVKNAMNDLGMETTRVMRATIIEMDVYDTGNLEKSIEPEYEGLNTKIKTAGAQPAEYWTFQNYGTSKITPRPFAQKTVEKILADQVFERAITKELTRLGLK